MFLLRFLILLAPLAFSTVAHSGTWTILGDTEGVQRWARVSTLRGSNVYVETKLVFRGKEMWPDRWVVNCQQKVMVNEIGTEWVYRSGIWRSARDNKAATTGTEDLFFFACGN